MFKPQPSTNFCIWNLSRSGSSQAVTLIPCTLDCVETTLLRLTGRVLGNEIRLGADLSSCANLGDKTLIQVFMPSRTSHVHESKS